MPQALQGYEKLCLDTSGSVLMISAITQRRLQMPSLGFAAGLYSRIAKDDFLTKYITKACIVSGFSVRITWARLKEIAVAFSRVFTHTSLSPPSSSLTASASMLTTPAKRAANTRACVDSGMSFAPLEELHQKVSYLSWNDGR